MRRGALCGARSSRGWKARSLGVQTVFAVDSFVIRARWVLGGPEVTVATGLMNLELRQGGCRF